MKRFERGAKVPADQAATLPASIDFFGSMRTSTAAAKQGTGNGGKQKTAKRARGIDGRAHSSRDDEEEETAQARPSEESEPEGMGEDNSAEVSSAEEDEGVQLISGGKKSKGSIPESTGPQSVIKGKRTSKQAAMDARREELAVFRRQMRIGVTGDEVAAPAGSFEEMQFPKEAGWLRSGIEAAGWKEPTPIQMQAVPVMLEGRDILACAPTGSGKTGAFVIPLFALLQRPQKAGIRGLIVSPTRELATQIYQQCQVLRAHSKLECKLLTKATAAAVADMQGSGPLPPPPPPHQLNLNPSTLSRAPAGN